MPPKAQLGQPTCSCEAFQLDYGVSGLLDRTPGANPSLVPRVVEKPRQNNSCSRLAHSSPTFSFPPALSSPPSWPVQGRRDEACPGQK